MHTKADEGQSVWNTLVNEWKLKVGVVGKALAYETLADDILATPSIADNVLVDYPLDETLKGWIRSPFPPLYIASHSFGLFTNHNPFFKLTS